MFAPLRCFRDFGFSIVFAATLILVGCTPPPSTAEKPQVFVNPGDNLLVSSSKPGGAAIFGLRDDNGLPIRITQVNIPAPSSPLEGVQAYFDSGQRLERAVLGNGDSASFEYVSNTRFFMTIRSVEGKESGRVPIDLTGFKSSSALGGAAENPLAGGGLKGMLDSRCGVTFVNGDVSGTYSRPSDVNPTPLAFTPLSGGGWEYSLPALPVPQPEKEKKAREAIAKVRQLWGQLCGEGTGGTLISAVELFTDIDVSEKVCKSVFKTQNLIQSCQKLAKRLKELCPIKDLLLDAVEYDLVDNYSPKGYVVNLKIVYSETSYNPRTFEFGVPADATSIPTKVAQLPTENPGLGSFEVAPADPAPGQSYTVSMSILCAPEGTVLRLSVVGSDGYKNSVEHTVTVANPTASLSVPGAKQGVVDTVTAKILPGGPEGSISVTF